MTLNTETRLKNDDTNVSLWLQSTAHFAATAFRRYPIDMAGALHYIICELHKKRSDDLVLLREMLINVSGVELASNRTDHQIEAMSGGHFLLQVYKECLISTPNTQLIYPILYIYPSLHYFTIHPLLQ